MHTNKDLRDINVSKVFLLLREKFKIDSIEAQKYLAKEFFLERSYIQSYILPDREKHREINLQVEQTGILLRTLQELSPTKNPLFL